MMSFDIPKRFQIAGTYYRSDGSIPWWFALWRVFLLVAMLWISGQSIGLFYREGEIQYYPIYLTFWTQTLCLITCVFRFLSTCSPCLCDICFNKTYRIQTILTRTSLVMVTMVTINYWLFLFDGLSPKTSAAITQIQVHGVNFALMWIDYSISYERVHYRSIVWPMIFSVTYLLWNVIFEFIPISGLVEEGGKVNTNHKGHPYIYKQTDFSEGWEGPLSYVGCCFLAIVLITAFAAFIKNKILNRRGIQFTGIVELAMMQEDDAALW